MVKLKQILNLDSDTEANVIGNEATPVLSLSNSSTGPGLKLDNLVVTSTATIPSVRAATIMSTADLVVSSTATINANATLEPAAHFQNTMIQGATQETVTLGVSSTASAPAIRLVGTAFVSCTSILWTGAALAGVGVIRVAHSDTDTLGWIPVLPNTMVDTVAWE